MNGSQETDLFWKGSVRAGGRLPRPVSLENLRRRARRSRPPFFVFFCDVGETATKERNPVRGGVQNFYALRKAWRGA